MFCSPSLSSPDTLTKSPKPERLSRQRRAYRWEGGQCLQRCHFKRRECIIQPLLRTAEENLHEHQGYYQHMWRVERSADQSQSKKKKRKEKNVKKKKKKSQSHAGLQRREDAGGYSRKWPLWLYGIWDVQWRCKGRKFLSCFFSFPEITAEDKEKRWVCSSQSAFHTTATKQCVALSQNPSDLGKESASSKRRSTLRRSLWAGGLWTYIS